MINQQLQLVRSILSQEITRLGLTLEGTNQVQKKKCGRIHMTNLIDKGISPKLCSIEPHLHSY